MNYDLKELKPYRSLIQGELIPLHPWNKKIKGDQRGKTPIHNDWNTKEYKQDSKQIKHWIESGYNIGYRIGEDELIVDLDPRNYADHIDSEAMVAELFGFFDFDELIWELPVVRTGGGGYHIYCKLPEGLDYRLIRKCTENLPGVDFKKKGGYVVAAGSKHPDGDYYRWENEAAQPIVPEELLFLIQRDELTEREYKSGYGAFNGSQLYDLILSKLDIHDYDSNDTWEPIMMAAHHATAGEGIEEFLDWSLGDTRFNADENKIRNRWESLDDSKHVSRTAASLIRELKQNGEDMSDARAILEFSTQPDFSEADDEEAEDNDLLSAAKQVGSSVSSTDVVDVDPYEYDGKHLALSIAKEMGPKPSKEEMNKFLRSLKIADMYDKEEAIDIVTGKTSYNRQAINRMLKGVDDQITKDLSVMLSNVVLEEVFNNKKHIIVEPNESVWVYNKTHWEQVSTKYLERLVRNALVGMKKNMEINIEEVTLIKKAAELVKMEVAVNRSRLHTTDAPSPVICCQNMAIHIRKDGTHETKPNSYRNYSVRCLNANYDPDAKAPLFMQTLREIFRDFPDTDDMIEYIGEVYGYIIQPYKNLSAWWLFLGPGGDGKSTLATHILQGVLGSAFTPGTTSLINSKISNNDNHSMMGLVGSLALVIGDFKKGAVIDDEKVKEYADNKVMQANPKGKDRFNFMYSAGMIVCSNHLPKTSDNSYGFCRRVNVVPFNRQFTKDGNGVDSDRATKILESPEELSGILNFMLEGLERLRNRGHFKIPQSCKEASENWLSQTNNASKFVADTVDMTGDLSDSLGSLATLYNVVYYGWCDENEVDNQYRLGKIHFKEKLEELGFVVRPSTGNVTKVFGGRLKDVDVDEW